MILQTHTEMKKFIITPILALLVTAGTALMAQDYPDEYLGLPGDNLNLYAVMNLFQESPTIEDFEKNLNDANSRINNLDLNGDNLVDYITVSDYIDGNIHTIVLRTALNRFENQDLAVFTVQKFRDGTVQIQLVGDEALYGRNYIVEPVYDNNYAGTYNPGYTGNSRVRVNITLVSDWPIVRYIYYPGYSPWHSSWYWGYYPVYWNPWRPYYWHYYYGYHYNHYRDYYRFYRRWDHIRCDRYHDFYYGRIRSHSPMVSRRIREGVYSSTYSRPELRREGEAQYSRVYAERNQARSVSNTVNSQTRRSASQPTRDYASATQGNSSVRRQSPSTTSSGSVQRSTSAQRPSEAVQNRNSSGNTTVRRSAPQSSAPAVQNRTTSRTTTAQRPATAQRSATAPDVSSLSIRDRCHPAVQNRSVSRPEAVQRPSAPQRTAPAASARSSAAPQSSPRREIAAPSRPSAPTARASSAPARSSAPAVRSSSAPARSSAPAARSSSAPARSSAPAPAARSSSSSGRSSSSRESGSSQSSRRN